MLNSDFIKTKHLVIKYTKQVGSKTAFNFSSGASGILPAKLYLTDFIGSSKGRPAKQQVEGKYKLTEAGLYANMNNRKIHTKIVSLPTQPFFVGWGEIDQRFNIYDLLVFYSPDYCQATMEIHLFKGLANIDHLESVLCYLADYIINTP